MATTRKKTPTSPERTEPAPQAASRAATRTTTARTATARTEQADPSPASWERVSRRAFELWQQAGQPHGRDLEHWLRAEAELRGK